MDDWLKHAIYYCLAQGYGLNFSQQHPHDKNVKQRPISLEQTKVSVDLNSMVGEGSYAKVYQGLYKGKECAVKVFHIEVVRKDIEREPQLPSIILHHPNVVLVHGLWHGSCVSQLPGNQPALVMELCNTTLSKHLKDKVDHGVDESVQLHLKVKILRDVAAGMIYLHSVQVMHGNLSANTVLLNVSESTVIAKVTGFGESRLLNPGIVCNITAKHRKSGIMPPEVKDCEEPVDLTKAVDVYSFGCLIPHVASCKCPELCRDPLGWWHIFDCYIFVHA